METGMIINKISHRLRRRSQAVQESIGISEAQGRILNYILAEGSRRNVYQKDIEEEFDLRPPTASSILRSLEKQEMISRVPDETDGRLKKLIFTEKADKIRLALEEEIVETERRLLDGITDEEQKMFLRLAEKMFHNLEE
ncbi:MarR family transcriptional regulator [Eubacterium sp. An11]|uniref:MarR family winged helix-turn-helix transcriptional regulator n=1 Tax=Eubacterium sp. An11 TaxID=1965542 RepID=UPI000B378329|nr:MarR family transcriptional regulator [Eubacterium sp. An11]OUQ69172.1 MarR family transcriptional regulator [Eubacterium sp. An11]